MSCQLKDNARLGELVASGEDTLVLFYASWCPFSRKFLPIFEKHASGDNCFRVLTDEVAGVEASYAIDFVPTVIFFHKGKTHLRLNGIAGEGLTEAMLLGLLTTSKLCSVPAAKGEEK